MSQPIHSFADLNGYDRQGIRYLWSDARASKDFAWPMDEVEALALRAEPASLRSRLGLCIALYEVVVARLRELNDDPYPALVVESAWLSLADRRYLEFDERARDEWLGPVRGPLWCGFTWLTPALHEADDSPADWESAFVYLARLAHHLLPESAHAAYRAWLEGCIDRIVLHHPAPVVRPTEDLFGRWKEWRRGPYVTAACFDLGTPYDPTAEHDRLERLLQSTDVAANPLLKSPEALEEEGLAHPYQALAPYDSLKR
ncbi:L-serine deaminase [Labilithrix luteola]|uniref:L-serine deaminase n=1 Tax=Labilithrix luteola TaxID=1391654 RepID=A0A0K1PUZ5_9BACT|nr:hypothetical protein [Labilithrix luteola]AKU97353.1 L-serine deaminase [Labilithrix luteola]